MEESLIDPIPEPHSASEISVGLFENFPGYVEEE
jgi:hypothetical protein